jgi:6-phosphogluconolactonase
MMRRLILLAGLVTLTATCGPLRFRGGGGGGSAAPSGPRTFVYVGTEGGIVVFELDRPTGMLVRRSSSSGLGEVTAMAGTRDGSGLVAVSATSGTVASLGIDAQSGALTTRGHSSVGGRPSAVALDRSGRYAFVVNASGGGVAVLPIKPDGSFATAKSFDAGAGARDVAVHPGNDAVLVANQRAGTVSQFSFGTGTGMLTPKPGGAMPLPPKTGPRGLAFAPSGRWLYLLDEPGDAIDVYGVEEHSKTLAPMALQIVSTLPHDFAAGKSRPLALVVAPNGKFVYGLNRGADSIVTFGADNATGTLTPLDGEPCGGRDPSDLAITPSGTYLVVTLEGAHTVTSFHLDPKTGAPTPVDTAKVSAVPLSLLVVSPGQN